MKSARPNAAEPLTPWYRTTLAIALVGSLLLWAALPPLALGPLGWIAPVPWLLLVRADELPGRRPYRMLWFAGFVFWLAAIHWLRLPHPAVHVGWVALSAYLAIYLPVFVALSRVAVHRLRVPMWLAAPVVWTGLELARAHVMTGFLMGSLAHSQVHWPAVIQIADLVGEYGVDFVMMAVAACVADCGLRIADCGLTARCATRCLVSSFPAVVLILATLTYGYQQLQAADENNPQSAIQNPKSTVRLALIQGNSLADWKMDPERQQTIMNEYLALSLEALDKARAAGGRPIDLIVWPETMFRSPLRSFEPGYQVPPNVGRTADEIVAADSNGLAELVSRLGTSVLVGIDRIRFVMDEGEPSLRHYNSSVLVDRDGKIVGTYDKVHLVVFGEYVPFSGWLPFLKNISSITGSADPGAGPVALCLDGVCYVPNICYETAIPHVIRHQVATLQKRGRSSFFRADDDRSPPDAEKRAASPFLLVNLTNDAWYWGSSELDMHLACDVFRAVETRTPLVVAANGGISAWIDAWGRLRAQSPRMERDVILADVELRVMTSHYIRFGDWFAGACLACCIALAVIGWRWWRESKSDRRGRRR
jgi:apolipoprotein N-acyltransferase